MKRVFLVLCIGLLISVAGSFALGDAKNARSSSSLSITFPTTGFYYSADIWNKGFPGASRSEAGCGTTAGDICGTAADINGSVTSVQVSVRKGSGASGKYWDGSAFNSNAEVFITADGTSNWNLNFGFERFPAGIYTVHVRATDSAGNTESGPIRIFSATPSYAVVRVISSMEVIGKGSYPASVKLPEMLDLKVFDRAEYRTGNDGEVEPRSYANIWEGTADRMLLVPTTSQLLNPEASLPPLATLSGVRIQYGNDDAYLYEIMVPADTNANRTAFGISGSYLVIGKGMVCVKGSISSDAGADGQCVGSGGRAVPVYTGTDIHSVQPGRLLSEKRLDVAVDGNGRVHSMVSRAIEGTPLVISVPAYIEWTGATELVPIVYESVDGDWQSLMNIVPPNGVVADMPSAELRSGSGENQVAQIAITGLSPGSTITGITHNITCNGNTIRVQMNLGTERKFAK